MSIANVRDALEIKLNSMASPISYAWQNVSYTPVTGIPYCAAYVMPAKPGNPTIGDGFYREQGIFQVNLMYPLLTGAQAAEARAELIRAAFKRGTALTSGGVKVVVDRTPEIGQGRADDDRWMVPVKIQWSAGVIA